MKMPLPSASKYDQIKAYLLDEALKPESRLKMSTVQELMRKFGASQSPVSRAIRDLEQKGIVQCRRGSGMTSCSSGIKEKEFQKQDSGFEQTILYLKTDYFSESIWNMEHTILNYARQNRIAVITYRIGKETDSTAIIELEKRTRRISGIIMNCDTNLKSDQLIEYLNGLPFPVVMINSSNIYENAADHVTILSLDSAQAGRLCLEALVKAGHTKIGYIRNEPESDLSRMRLSEIMTVAEQSNVSVTYFTATVKAWENSAKAAEKITQTHLEEIRELGFTALIYYSGQGALAGRRVLQLAGYRIPDDISIICEDDGSSMELLYPAGSVVVGQYLEQCRDALDIICGKLPSPKIRFYPYRFIERESIRNLKE